MNHALEVLRSHEPELRKMGVKHAAVFGSVARGEDRPDSDLDVLVDLDPENPIGLFEYAGIGLYLEELLGKTASRIARL